MTRRLLYSAEDRASARCSPWWWSLAENPPCVPWCTAEHDDDEFRVEGSLACHRTFTSQPSLQLVEVSAFQGADADTPFRVERPEVAISVRSSVEDLGPGAALALAVELRRAGYFLLRAC